MFKRDLDIYFFDILNEKDLADPTAAFKRVKLDLDHGQIT